MFINMFMPARRARWKKLKTISLSGLHATFTHISLLLGSYDSTLQTLHLCNLQVQGATIVSLLRKCREKTSLTSFSVNGIIRTYPERLGDAVYEYSSFSERGKTKTRTKRHKELRCSKLSRLMLPNVSKNILLMRSAQCWNYRARERSASFS